MQFFAAKTLIATCIFASVTVLAIQPTFAATAIKFRPGAAAPCDIDVNRMDSTATLADIDQYEDTNAFDWAVVNESPPPTTGLPDDKHIFFDIHSSTTSLPMGAAFDTAFTMTLLTNGPGGKVYGLDSPAGSIYTDNARSTLSITPARFPSHVFMTASLKGTLRAARSVGTNPIFNLVKSNPEFSQARFRMFFDIDGDLATTVDQVLIAKFGTASTPDPASSLASTTFIDKATAAVIVNWDSALPGVFADQNGNEIATGAVDAADHFLREVSPATQSTSKAEIDFGFECATAGACTVVNGNILSFRLHMASGHSTVFALAPRTTPAAALCPAKLENPNFGDAVCFPFAFCPFPYFGILVLALVAVALVVVVVIVKKNSQRAQ